MTIIETRLDRIEQWLAKIEKLLHAEGHKR